MAWNPLLRDAQKLAATEGSQYDFTVDEYIRFTDAATGREKVVALRQLVEGFVNGTVDAEPLLRALEILEESQVNAAKEVQQALKQFPDKAEFLTRSAEIFLSLADHFGDMIAYTEAEQHGSLLGALALVEAQVTELDQLILANP